VHEPEDYIPLVAAAHEMMKAAARLADEAREIEKGADSVLRRPHFKDGTVGEKRRLMEKLQRIT
jgi:methylenetetrahydromethanopterin dehydrogenase